MRFLLLFLVTWLKFGPTSAQQITIQEFRPFTILVIQPSHALIPDSLMVYADLLERNHRQGYLIAIKDMQTSKKYATKKEREEIDLEIAQIRISAKDSSKFKYYHRIANKTFNELRTLFNTTYNEQGYSSSEEILTGEIVDPNELATQDLDVLRRHYRFDYVITFEDVRMGQENGVLTLEYVMTVYSRKANMVILRNQIVGNAPVENFKFLKNIRPPGNMHESRIDCDNYLECAIMSAVRFSTEALYQVFNDRQKK